MYIFFKKPYSLLILLMPLFFLIACKKKEPKSAPKKTVIIHQDSLSVLPKRSFRTHIVSKDVPVSSYFEYMDKVLITEAWRVHYPLSEHIIVWANPWIIDTLANTDYYRLKEKGIYSYDQTSIVILRKGTKLIIPDSIMADSISKILNATTLDVNIPEFKLRILQNGKTIAAYPIRVGKHKTKYLAMAGRTLELQTKIGKGKILQVNKNAVYKNPVDNKVYYKTHRDDGEYTLLPRLPWMVPEINNTIYGQLIHPTTNPATLGKMSSNGCIGMKEADIWNVYYHAPIGTPIEIRYDLKGVDEKGDTIELTDIYGH